MPGSVLTSRSGSLFASAEVVGNRRSDMKVENVEHYFYGNDAKDQANFSIPVGDQEVAFRDLDDDLVRRFKDYAISTIEIDLDDDEASCDEIVRAGSWTSIRRA